jgi:NAD(P) transhydrogenase subunit alpha
VLALLELMLVDGKVAPDFSDEIIAKSCVTRVAESVLDPESGTESESESEEKEA